MVLSGWLSPEDYGDRRNTTRRLIAGSLRSLELHCEAYPRRRHDKQDRLARRIDLPATHQLQSMAQRLSVDANARTVIQRAKGGRRRSVMARMTSCRAGGVSLVAEDKQPTHRRR
jgi:hypothetical protein